MEYELIVHVGETDTSQSPSHVLLYLEGERGITEAIQLSQLLSSPTELYRPGFFTVQHVTTVVGPLTAVKVDSQGL